MTNIFEIEKAIKREGWRLYLLFLFNIILLIIVINILTLLVGKLYIPHFLVDVKTIGNIPYFSHYSQVFIEIAIIILVCNFIYTVRYYGDPHLLAQLVNGYDVTGEMESPQFRQLNEVVDEIVLAYALKPPFLYYVEGVLCINAITYGSRKGEVAIIVTEGVLSLERHQMQALMAHQLGLAKSGALHLNRHSMAVLGALMGFVSLGKSIWRNSTRAFREAGSNDHFEVALVMIAIGLIGYFISTLLIVFGSVFYFIGRVLQSKLALKWEYLADVNALIAMRQGLPLIELLQYLQREGKPIDFLMVKREEEHLLFVASAEEKKMSAHLALNQRIDRLYDHIPPIELEQYIKNRQRDRANR